MSLFSKDPDKPTIRSLRRGAKRSEDPAEAAELYTRAGELALEAEKTKKALSLFHAAIESLASHARASERLLETLRGMGELTAARDELERRLTVLGDSQADARTLALAHGRLAEAEKELTHLDEARTNYERAFEMDPSLIEMAQLARELAVDAGRWAEASEILEREIVVVTSRTRRAELLLTQARLKRDRLDDPTTAIALLSRAMKSDPGSAIVRRSLAETLALRAEQEQDPDQKAKDRHKAADVLCGMADMLSEEPRLACVERALDITPEHLTAIDLLEELVPAEDERLRDRWTRHVEAFPDGPISDRLRGRLGRLHLSEGRRDEAIRWFEQLAQAGDVEAGLTVVDLHVGAGRGDKARIWADELLEQAPEEEQLALMHRVFDAFRTGDPEEAYERAVRILARDPNDVDALSFCRLACEVGERWADLANLLTQLAFHQELDEGRRVGIFTDLARLQEDQQFDVLAALATWRDIELLTDEENREARDERVRLAELAEQWDELVELLQERAAELSVSAANAESSERTDVFQKLFVVHREQRADPERAIDALLSLLRQETDAHDAVRGLKDALREAGPGSGSVSTVSNYAESASESQQLALFRALGQLFEEWGDVESAFGSWTRVRGLRQEDNEALGRLTVLAIGTGRYEHALELLAYRAERATGETLVDLRRRIAAIARDHLGDHDRAADSLAMALEAAPDDRSVADRLCIELGHAERFGEQSVILKLLVSSAPDVRSRTHVQERLARVLAERLGKKDDALGIWQDIARSNERLEVLEPMCVAARRENAPQRLELLLARVVTLEPDPAKRCVCALERAELLRTLGRVDEARAALFDSIRTDASRHLPSLSMLEELCEELDDEAGLAEVLELSVRVTTGSARRHVLRRLADLYEGPLDDPDRAVAALSRWEGVQTHEIEPRLRLVSHLARRNDWDALLSRLDRLIHLERDARQRWIRLVARSVEAALADHPSAGDQGRARDNDSGFFFLGLAERAKFQEQRLELTLRAVDRFESAREWGPAFVAITTALTLGEPEASMLDRADRLAVQATAIAQLDVLYERFTTQAANPETRKHLVLRQASLLGQGGRHSDALERLLRISAMAPDDVQLMEAMERAAAVADRVGDLLSIYEERAAMLGAGERGILVLLRAVTFSYRSEHVARVPRLLAQAVQLSEGVPEHLDRIEAVARDHGLDAMRCMVQVYGAAANDADVPRVMAALLLVRAARLVPVEPGAEGAVFNMLKRALSLAPSDEHVLTGVEEAAAGRDLIKRLDGHLESVIEETMDNVVAAALLRRRGRILQQRLGRPNEAANAFLRLWAMRPDDVHVLSDLRVCLIETDRVHELISACERALKRRREPAHRRQLMRDIAELWEEGAHNDWEALDAWERVLKEAPNDARALDESKRLSDKTRSRPPATFADDKTGPKPSG